MKSTRIDERRFAVALIAGAIILAVGGLVGAAHHRAAAASDAAASVHPKAGAAEARNTLQPVAASAPKAGASAARAAAAPQAPVTVTGCLERNADTFRLKNTTGAEIPRSRSWKSGFLKKGQPTIQIVDSANTLKLPDHVGERVTLTGMLVDRSMTVRSLRRVSESCRQEA